MSTLKEIDTDIDGNKIFLIRDNVCVSEAGEILLIKSTGISQTLGNYAVLINELDENLSPENLEKSICDLSNILVDDFMIDFVKQTITRDNLTLEFDLVSNIEDIEYYKEDLNKLQLLNVNDFFKDTTVINKIMIKIENELFFIHDSLILDKSKNNDLYSTCCVEAILKARNFQIDNFVKIEEII